MCSPIKPHSLASYSSVRPTAGRRFVPFGLRVAVRVTGAVYLSPPAHSPIFRGRCNIAMRRGDGMARPRRARPHRRGPDRPAGRLEARAGLPLWVGFVSLIACQSQRSQPCSLFARCALAGLIFLDRFRGFYVAVFLSFKKCFSRITGVLRIHDHFFLFPQSGLTCRSSNLSIKSLTSTNLNSSCCPAPRTLTISVFIASMILLCVAFMIPTPTPPSPQEPPWRSPAS
jgi:hypothetical protein